MIKKLKSGNYIIIGSSDLIAMNTSLIKEKVIKNKKIKFYMHDVCFIIKVFIEEKLTKTYVKYRGQYAKTNRSSK